MYGWINQCLEDMIIEKFGLSVWQNVQSSADCFVQTGEFIRSVHYDDSLTYKLVEAASKIVNLPMEDLLDNFGRHFVDFLEAKGYSGPFRGQGNSFREWVFNINEPHRLLRPRFPCTTLPEFWVDEDPHDCDSLFLHYYSAKAGGFEPVVVAIVKMAAEKYFQREVTMKLLVSETLQKSKFLHHAMWRVGNVGHDSSPEEDETVVEDDVSIGLSTSWRTESFGDCLSSSMDMMTCRHASARGVSTSPKPSLTSISIPALKLSGAVPPISKPNTPSRVKWTTTQGVGMDPKTMCRVFPYHIALNRQLQIIQIGSKLHQVFSQHGIFASMLPFGELFSMAVTDNYDWSWTEICKLPESHISIHISSAGSLYGTKFVGEVVLMGDEADGIALFLVNPGVDDLESLLSLDLKLTDLPRHAFQRDILQIEEHLRNELQHSVEVTMLNQRLESESRRLKESLDALRTKRVFVRYISHEIRTPLNVALLGLKCLDDDQSKMGNSRSIPNSARSGSEWSTDDKADILNDIRKSCIMAVDILNDLLLYEKMDDGLFSLNSCEHSISLVLSETERLFRVQAKAVEVKLSLQISPDASASMLMIDRCKMQQVFRNLVSNAIKFTRPGGKVSISCELLPRVDSEMDSNIVFAPVLLPTNLQHTYIPLGSDQPFVRIFVQDSGCGISLEDQRKLFGQFVQFKADQLQCGQGSGLGLWIASNIVHLHDGRIGASSRGEGFGTTFVIDLPFVSLRTPRGRSKFDFQTSISVNGEVRVPVLPLSSFGAGSPASHGTPRFTPRLTPRVTPRRTVSERRLSPSYRDEVDQLCSEMRVLVVDDSLTNRKMVRRALEGKFDSIIEAENGLIAVQLYEDALDNDEPFDLVLMDGTMPVMDGLEATRQILSMDNSALVIGVSGNAFDEDISSFRSAGAATVLIKPLNIPSLEDSIWLHRNNFTL